MSATRVHVDVELLDRQNSMTAQKRTSELILLEQEGLLSIGRVVSSGEQELVLVAEDGEAGIIDAV